MVDYHYPLPGAHMGGNHHPTGIIPRNNMWHTSEHGIGRSSKNNNQISYDNQIPEVRRTFLWLRETGIFTQRGRHPLYLVRVCHGNLSGQHLSRNNNDHGMMGKQRLTAWYPHPGQWPQKGHHYPHDNQSRFLHNTINRSFLPHTRTRQHIPTKAEPKQTRTITYNFIPLTNALKWSPRK